MKRRFTILMAALLLMSGLSRAQQITWSAADQGYENGAVIESVDFNDYVSAEFFKGTNNNAPKYYTTGTAIRCYGGNYFTVTSDYLLTEIVLGFSSGEGTNAITTDCGDYTNGTWTGSANEVTFTIGGTSGHRRIATFEITYTEGDTPAPSITASNVEIDYDATSGSIEYTVNNPVEGGVLTANTEAEWLTIGTVGEETIAFTCTANEGAIRTATVTVTYTYGDNETVTKNVTVTQAAAPVLYTTIPDLFAAATSTETPVYVTFNNWVVSGVSTNGKNVFVTDNNGNGFVIYDNNGGLENTYTAGDILAGTAVSCTLKKYNGFAELLNVDANDITITTGGTVTVANVEMADLVGVNTGALLHYDNLTCSVSNNKYYLSDGTTTLQVYNALYAFEALEDGKTYNITGIYQQYNNTKEILPRSAADIEEVVSAVPSVTVTPNAINAPAEDAEGTLAITYENIEELISFDIQFCDANGGELEGNDPDWIYAEINEPGEEEYYTVSYIIYANEGEARTAYFKVYTFAGDDLEEVYAIVTVNQAEYVAPALDYAELPFEFDGGRDDIETTDGLTQEGLDTDYSSSPKLKFKTTGTWVILHFNERPGTLTFDIKGNGFSGGTFTVQTSEDGETYTDLETYTELGNTQHESFDNLDENVRYIRWIYSEKVNGNVALGNITLAKPSTEPSISVSPTEINVSAEGQSGILSVTCNNVDASYEIGVQFYADSQTPTMDPQIYEDWLEIVPSGGSSNNFSYEVFSNEGSARSAYLTICAFADNGEIVTESQLVTINQDAPVVPPISGNWVLTNLADLTENDVFVIVGTRTDATYGGNYAMSNDNGTSAPSAVSITVVDGTLSEEPAANLQWNLGNASDGYIFYPNGTTETWLYCTDTNNGVKVGDNENNIFTMDDSGYLKHEATTRYIGLYNAQDWRCYTNTTGNIANQTFAFYKKVSEPIIESYDLTINGFEAGTTGGYCLIASPVTVDPATVGMTSGDFDLYSFDEGETDEWRNYEAQSFNLVPGKGYLYAKQASTEGEIFHFTLAGTPYNNQPITLSKTEGADWSGWNLVGNPFGQAAYIDRDYYTMNEAGTEIISVTGRSVQIMEGIFVTAEEDGEEMQFSTEAPAEPGEKIIMNVTRNRGNVIDRAIVRFGEGRMLPKFQLNENSTKIYMTEGNQDFAIVRSADEGEMPVNFKASENGNYTLSVNAENVEMNYLHLIDNMTGADVDLLSTPSYSFEARTTDYASRFKLVFATGNADDNFAFFSNGNFVINNEGEATLQVIDMMGRVLSSEQINGSYNKSLNLSAGVYVLRLSNGNAVKTQKVVID